ncbi:hypothetical protein [Streptomyces diastatochromogenes]|uniref:hypothetical protein n=1 Tax=Streptomyces diastatochromogenes TaxID=42236 RepID=UPI00117F995B|nr:hypothetical protein [Streptomyces diastatochromogenes]
MRVTTRSKRQVWGARLACAGLTTAVALGLAVSPASAADSAGPPSQEGVQPILELPPPENPTCDDLIPGAFDFAFKVDPPTAGNHQFDAPHQDGSVDIGLDNTDPDHVLVNFLIHGPYAARGVIVKGGPVANFYDYNATDFPTGIKADALLHAAINDNNGTYYGLSHIDFCLIPKKY